MRNILVPITALLLCINMCVGQILPDSAIIKRIEAFRPSGGAMIPSDLKRRLGTTHAGGRYNFTKEPFLIEGAKKVKELGYGTIKLWFNVFNIGTNSYPYNSKWDLPQGATMKDLASHPYFKKVFSMGFTTISLVNTRYFPKHGADVSAELLDKAEQEIYDLTKYLLKTYADRDITFIIQNWEGDWLLRGGTGPEAKWHINGVPEDYLQRVNNMCKWLGARQRGVDRARAEAAGGKSRCRVLHAIEANRVMDGMKGIPSIASHVLPRVEADLVSWSAYDGIPWNAKRATAADGLRMYKGIDYLRANLRPTAYMGGKKVVMIGEIGYAENVDKRTPESIAAMWDVLMAVYFAQDIPLIFYWELYCNETKVDEAVKKSYPIKTADELRGFWLIRPDGSKGHAQKYFETLLKSSGKHYER